MRLPAMGWLDRKRPSKAEAEKRGREKAAKRQRQLSKQVDKWDDQERRKQRRTGVWPW